MSDDELGKDVHADKPKSGKEKQVIVFLVLLLVVVLLLPLLIQGKH